MSYTTREVDIESMSDEELEPMLHMVNLLNAEAEPRSVAWAIDELRMFSTSPGQVRLQFVVEDDSGAPVGTLAISRSPQLKREGCRARRAGVLGRSRGRRHPPLRRGHGAHP